MYTHIDICRCVHTNICSSGRDQPGRVQDEGRREAKDRGLAAVTITITTYYCCILLFVLSLSLLSL